MEAANVITEPVGNEAMQLRHACLEWIGFEFVTWHLHFTKIRFVYGFGFRVTSTNKTRTKETSVGVGIEK